MGLEKGRPSSSKSAAGFPRGRQNNKIDQIEGDDEDQHHQGLPMVRLEFEIKTLEVLVRDPVQTINQQSRRPVSKEPRHLFFADASDRKAIEEMPPASYGRGVRENRRDLR